MTEQEAVKILKSDSCWGCPSSSGSAANCTYGACRMSEATRKAIAALKEIQQYRAIKKRLADMFGGELTLTEYVDMLEYSLAEPGKPHPVNARILTYEEADAWEAYKAIGTAEECRKAVEKLKTAKEAIRKLLCSEYGSVCQFCKQDNNADAMCRKVGGSWCCEKCQMEWQIGVRKNETD